MDSKNWLLENITKYSNRINFLRDCMEATGIAQRTAQQYYKELFLPQNNLPGNPVIENNNPEFSDLIPGSEPDKEIVEENTRLSKKLQKNVDKNRIERKAFREHARVENIAEELTESLIEAIETYHKPFTIKHEEYNIDSIGIFNIADLHANELVKVCGNEYDFEIAAKRLKKYVIQAKKYFKAFDVQHVLVCNLADNLNSDRRLDEALNMAQNRSRASLLTAYLLEQVITDLNKDFNITYSYICGNESRVDKEFSNTDIMITNNYDHLIHQILKIMFKDTDIDFLEGPYDEKVLNVNNKNILIMHGHQFNNTDLSKQIQQVKGKYNDKSISIDYVLFGHKHECRIADGYARSGSVVGANAYSDGALQLSSRASQLMGVVENDDINITRVDLQDIDGIEGYDITEELAEYNAKSLDKIHRKEYAVISEINA